jgi:hypothetical protein
MIKDISRLNGKELCTGTDKELQRRKTNKEPLKTHTWQQAHTQ